MVGGAIEMLKIVLTPFQKISIIASIKMDISCQEVSMKISRVLFGLILVIFLLPGNASAFWWLFGKSEAEVETRYLYLNNIAFSETGSKVVFYRDMLPNGVITIRGQAAAGRNKIGSVRITTDDKNTWVDVRVSDNGTFEYSFRPEVGKTYKVYLEITDTTGKTNKINDTFKEITVSSMNIQAVVKDALDRLTAAYQNENPAEFMSFVADDFAGDRTLLDRAIRKDFLLFDKIYLRYILNNVVSDATGKVIASITFNRSVFSTRTGKILTDNGITEFTFKLGERSLRLWAMKLPLIFGLSDAENVATGVTNIGTNEPIIVVDSRGNVTTQGYRDYVTQVQSGATTEMGSKILTSSCTYGGPTQSCTRQGLLFADGSVVTNPASYDLLIEPDLFIVFRPGTEIKDLGIMRIESVTSVPTTGYTGYHEIPYIDNKVGHCFALLLPDGKYAVLEIVNVTNLSVGGTAACRVNIKYKYQPTAGINTF